MVRKSKKMTNDVRKLIAEMKLEGKKTYEIEHFLGISESTIRSVWKNYLNTVEINKTKRSRRPPKMSQRDRNWLVRQTKMNRGFVLSSNTNELSSPKTLK